VERTEGNDANRQKTDVKAGADHQDDLPRHWPDGGSFPEIAE
jgi:hypothetical protein